MADTPDKKPRKKREPTFTDTKARELKPKAVRYEYADRGRGNERGLYLVVQPSGSKSWAFRYISPTNRKRAKLTIGRYPAITLEKARTKAREAAGMVADDIDPSAEKKRSRAAAAKRSDEIGALLDAYDAEHIENKRERTAEEMRRALRLHVRPEWGRRKVGEITSDDVSDLLQKVVKGGTKRPNGSVARRAPIGANRLHALLRHFFKWVAAPPRSLISTSPVAGLKKPTEKEESRDRVFSDKEIRWIWRATAGGSPLEMMVRILLLTGQRRSEVAAMRWDELTDLRGTEPIWSIPAERSKNGVVHDVPLSPEAVATIVSVQRVAHCPFVLTTTGRSAVSGFSRFKAALARDILVLAKTDAAESGDDPDDVTLQGWRLHDLRRTVSTRLARLKVGQAVNDAVLNHISGKKSGVAGIYNRYKYADEKRDALNCWGAELSRIVAEKPAADNVVVFKQPA